MHPFQTSYALDANHPEARFFFTVYKVHAPMGGCHTFPPAVRTSVLLTTKDGFCKCLAILGPLTKVAHDFKVIPGTNPSAVG